MEKLEMEKRVKVLDKIYEHIAGIKTIIENEELKDDDFGKFLSELYDSFDDNGTLLGMDQLYESYGH